MPQLLTITVSDEGPVTRIAVGGELDMSTVPRLRGPLLAGCKDADALRLDLSALTFMDSTGLHLLAEAAETASGSGCALTLTSPSAIVVKMLDLTGLRDAFSIETSH